VATCLRISSAFAVVVSWALLPNLGLMAAGPTPTTVDFARDIRPILSENCFQCHGPDAEAREADLRLDQREGFFGGEGAPGVVVPHRPDESEMFLRISGDDDRRMPPPDIRERLAPAKVELIRRWIDEGAKWRPNWAFVAPQRPAGPRVKNAGWVRNPIDAFIIARLQQERLSPSLEADRETLIRRITLDLTGLPPTPEEVDAFLADDGPDAYERLVDRLLASPRYGERMAVPWLNAARYADTYGYQDDGEVSMWRWRDWIIEAFNANMPFDQFTIEQLAGDLLPNPTLEQRLATGFNRNHRHNSEGGAIPEEFRTEYVVDRVDTTATVWLGLTLVCARCHDHKYDPITQREFYQLFAFFNNVPEDGRARKQGNTPPLMLAPTRDQRVRQAERQTELNLAREALANLEPEIARLQAKWEESVSGQQNDDFTITRALEVHFPLDGNVLERQGNAKVVTVVDGDARFARGKVGQALVFDGKLHLNAGNVADYSDDQAFSLAAWVSPEKNCYGSIVSRTKDGAKPEGIDLLVHDSRLHVHLNVEWSDDAIRLETVEQLPANEWTHVAVTVDGSRFAKGVRVYFNGVLQPVEVQIDLLYQSFGNNGPFRIGASGDPASHFRGQIDDVRVYEDDLTPEEVELVATAAPLNEIVGRPAEERTAAESRKLRAYYLANHAPPSIVAVSDRVRAAEEALERAIESFPDVMVMEEMTVPRPTRVLFRGQYDQPRDEVTPGVPGTLPSLPPEIPRTRLGLARWLVDPRHPLTARVTVNRLWQMSFGTGLVKTAEDFGAQGDPPSHPLLLDWLARELVESGWDIKAMRRLIVTSAAYRQSSRVTPQLLAADPENRLLARGVRFRLPVEMIRDQALYAGGLLVEELGGPSVKPYQPAGLWEELSNDKYEQDHGDKLYRRSLYVFWKRTVPFPAMSLFDAPSRETCQVREERTNTPLQALTLLNETAFLEAARGLAERAQREAGATPEERLTRAFRIVTSRKPREIELKLLLAGFHQHIDHYRKHPDAAERLLAVGERPVDESFDKPELAAHTAVANTLLNLDEAITQH